MEIGDSRKMVRTMHRGSSINIPVVYEDNHILVVEKPVNIPTQKDISTDPDLLSILKEDIKVRYQKPGNVYLGLVHRLDRPVGGIMVFAKTSKAASRLSDMVKNREFEKTYLAVIHGIPENKEKLVEHFLEKDRINNIVKVVSPDSPGGKKAALKYDVISSRNSLSLVSVQLYTGRSHQIRVQLSALGHPLYGDQKYGASVNRPGQQIALWSHKLSFMHPVRKETVTFTSMPPKDEPWNLFY